MHTQTRWRSRFSSVSVGDEKVCARQAATLADSAETERKEKKKKMGEKKSTRGTIASRGRLASLVLEVPQERSEMRRERHAQGHA